MILKLVIPDSSDGGEIEIVLSISYTSIDSRLPHKQCPNCGVFYDDSGAR